MQIKDLAVGDGFVYLNEGNSKVKFYVLAHNYESNLNGKGRTLFCRGSVTDFGTWNRYSGPVNMCAGWPDSNTAKGYMNSTYLNRFDATTKNRIGTTKYYVVGFWNYAGSNYQRWSNTSVRADSSAIFTISAAESVQGYSQSSGGSFLSKAARTRLEKIYSDIPSSKQFIWTRTLANKVSYEHSDDGDTFYFNGVYLSGVSSSDGGVFSCSNTYGGAGSFGYLPCFTLSENLYINSEGYATENEPPEVTSDAGATGAELGEKNAPFTVGYTVTDKDGDLMTVTEKLDGTEQAVKTEVATGTALTVDWLSEKVGYQQVVNGAHTLTLTVSDGKTTTDWTATFTKNVTGAKVSLTAPLTADDTITVAALTLEGSFPADMSLSVEMTNNGLDNVPVWENCTDIQSGESRVFVHHAFTNKTAARGFAFNYKVTIARGESGTGGTLTMIGGVIG